MSTVLTDITCKRCGFQEAFHEFDCRTNEWWVRCPRCGYYEECKYEWALSNGHVEECVVTYVYPAGAYSAVDSVTGVAEVGSLLETHIEKEAARMRADIASGKLSPESYVTRYCSDTREVTALVGQIPTVRKPEGGLGQIPTEKHPNDGLLF